jgi:hypothetical protein
MVSELRDKILAALSTGPKNVAQIINTISDSPNYKIALREYVIRKYMYKMRDEGDIFCVPKEGHVPKMWYLQEGKE